MCFNLRVDKHRVLALRDLHVNGAANQFALRLETKKTERFRILGTDQIKLYQKLYLTVDALKVGSHENKELEESELEGLYRTAALLCALLHRTCTSLSSRYEISETELEILEEAGQHFYAMK